MKTKMKYLSLAIVSTTLSMNTNALDILLTNDDGYTAPGINIMYNVLVAHGHNVTMVAPKSNQSGTGMSVNTNVGTPVEVINFGANKWFVNGSPVDAVNAGLDFVLKDNTPDLVISGSNFGENVGSLANHSGTVGAALEALQRGIPGIAISVGLNMAALQSGNPQAPLYTINAMDDAANFTAQVINKLIQGEQQPQPNWCHWLPQVFPCNLPQYEEGKLRLPAGVGLNLNYPPLEAGATTGVAMAKIGSWTTFDLTIGSDANGSAIVSMRDTGEPTVNDQSADAAMLEQGYVTVSTMSGDLNAPEFTSFIIERDLEDLTP